MEFCGGPKIIHKSNDFDKKQVIKECPDCSQAFDPPVCGIREDGDGFRARKFRNECELTKYNCKKGTQFTVTDSFICNDKKPETTDNEVTEKEEEEPVTNPIKIEELKKNKPLVIIDGSMIDKNNINESINNFFASTHVMNIRLKQQNMNESTRRTFIPIFGPRVVFKPWSRPPQNVNEDYMHSPLLGTCFHTCPTVFILLNYYYYSKNLNLNFIMLFSFHISPQNYILTHKVNTLR